MKIKTAFAAAVIAMSAQASYAATETSCNPFERGASCNGAFSAVGSSDGSTFTRFNRGVRASGGTSGFAIGRGQNRSFGLLMSSLSRANNPEIVQIDDADPIDEGTAVLTSDLDDERPVIGGGDNGEVAVVPVPAAGFLLLAGLGGLVAMRRRK